MLSLKTRRILSFVVGGAAICCLAASQRLFATAPNVIYTASGTFASQPVSGNDLLQLAGQPFSISVVANAASVPTNHGAQWAVYGGLTMQGTVQSGLFPPPPLTIQNRSTSIALATGNPNYDLFSMGTPVNVVGISLSVQARITMPKGTIANALIHPFTPVTLTAANAILQYSDSTASTTLAINGTLTATLAGAVTAAGEPMLMTGPQVITAHADGTRSVRRAGSAPVEVAAASDTVALQFYASGVRGASEVRVQIGGEDVPVLYAGPAGHFPGLDQVSVQVPRSMAGKGAADVSMTVDGRTAKPVHIQIQ